MFLLQEKKSSAIDEMLFDDRCEAALAQYTFEKRTNVIRLNEEEKIDECFVRWTLSHNFRETEKDKKITSSNCPRFDPVEA